MEPGASFIPSETGQAEYPLLVGLPMSRESGAVLASQPCAAGHEGWSHHFAVFPPVALQPGQVFALTALQQKKIDVYIFAGSLLAACWGRGKMPTLPQPSYIWVSSQLARDCSHVGLQ